MLIYSTIHHLRCIHISKEIMLLTTSNVIFTQIFCIFEVCFSFQGHTLNKFCLGPKDGLFYVSINSLWPGDTIWRHSTGSTSSQVMVCCLTAPGHYMNQWRPNVLWHSPVANDTTNTQDIYPWYENDSFQITATYSKGQWVDVLMRQTTHHELCTWFMLYVFIVVC